MQSPQITPSLPLGQAPHAVRRPSCRAAASRFHILVFHATFVPHAIPRPPHTWAVSPYGIAVSPYNHTPDAFPHTSQQIPIGWSSPHMVSADPPNNTARSKKLILNSTRPAFQFHKSPTNPVKQTPWTCVTVQQIKRRPSPANHTCLRSAGVPSSPACAHLHGHAHGHGHVHTCTGTRTFTAMFIPLRVMCTATSTSGHASAETSVRLTRIKRQPNSLKCPAAA